MPKQPNKKKNPIAAAKFDAVMELSALTIERNLMQRGKPPRERDCFEDIFASVARELMDKYRKVADADEVFKASLKHGRRLRGIVNEDGKPVVEE